MIDFMLQNPLTTLILSVAFAIVFTVLFPVVMYMIAFCMAAGGAIFSVMILGIMNLRSASLWPYGLVGIFLAVIAGLIIAFN